MHGDRRTGTQIPNQAEKELWRLVIMPLSPCTRALRRRRWRRRRRTLWPLLRACANKQIREHKVRREPAAGGRPKLDLRSLVWLCKTDSDSNRLTLGFGRRAYKERGAPWPRRHSSLRYPPPLSLVLAARCILHHRASSSSYMATAAVQTRIGSATPIWDKNRSWRVGEHCSLWVNGGVDVYACIVAHVSTAATQPRPGSPYWQFLGRR